MKPQTININNLSVEQILRYLKGEMPGPEMHAIERAALEDPFLSEAIDGYRNALLQRTARQVLDDVKAGREKISDRFRKNESKGKLLALPWLKFAAAAAVIVIAGYFIWHRMPGKDREMVAMTQKKQAAPQRDSLKSQPVLPKEDAAAMQAVQDKEKPVISNKTPRSTGDPQSNRKNKKTNAETRDIPKTLSAKTSGLVVETEKKSLDETAAGYYRAKKPEIHSFSGQVLDRKMKPLGAARINVPEQKNGFVTDEQGNFSLISRDTSLNVVVSAAGYRQQAYFLKPNITANRIVLDTVPDKLKKENIKSADTEILMNGQPDSAVSGIAMQNAVPVNGWADYQEYIEKNKKESDSAYSGTVTISFIVWKNGRKSHFKIENSVSPKLDAEAIQLIKNGPAWKVVKGMEARAFVSISF